MEAWAGQLGCTGCTGTIQRARSTGTSLVYRAVGPQVDVKRCRLCRSGADGRGREAHGSTERVSGFGEGLQDLAHGEATSASGDGKPSVVSRRVAVRSAKESDADRQRAGVPKVLVRKVRKVTGLGWDRVTWASDRNCATQRGLVCTLLQVLVGMCRSGLVQNGQYQQYPSWLGRWVMVLRGVIRQCLRATCNRTGTGTEARGRPGRGGGCGRGVVPDAGTQARRHAGQCRAQ